MSNALGKLTEEKMNYRKSLLGGTTLRTKLLLVL